MSRKSSQFVCKTLGEVARLFGVVPDTVKAWRTRGMPGANRRYDLAEIIPWYIAEFVRATAADSEGVDWDEKLTREKALKAEIERRRLEGELVERDAVCRVFAEHITTTRTILEGLPSRAAAFVPQDQRKAADAAITKLLNRALKTLAAGQIPSREKTKVDK